MATKSVHAKVATPCALLSRDQYGALHIGAHLEPVQIEEVHSLIRRAAAMKDGIPATYQSFSTKEYECLNHDVYDVVLVRGKVRAVVVQTRLFWKHLRKSRSSLKKSYFLVSIVRNKVSVAPLENATCVKRAKNTSKLGQLAGHYLGTGTVRCVTPGSSVCRAYKVLAKTGDGRLVSAFDGSEYQLASWRREAALPDHGGGFYFYWNEDLAVQATQRGDTFHSSVTGGKSLVLCEVEIGGKTVAYSTGKMAASRLRVVREVRAIGLSE